MKLSNINVNCILLYGPLFVVPSLVLYCDKFITDTKLTWITVPVSFILMIILVFYERKRIVKIIICDEMVTFIDATTKEYCTKIEQVKRVREVTNDKQFHFEVYVESYGWLKMADFLIGVEVIKDGK